MGSGLIGPAPHPLELDYEVKPASGPCAGCGKPITPGQLYIVDGPYHFGCSGGTG